MSKFIEAVRSQASGKRKAIYTPLSVDLKLNPYAGTGIIDEYDFRVEWSVQASCSKQDLPAMMKNVVRQLQEEVYGEFRERLIRLDRAVLEHDFEKARMEMRDLLSEVFA